MSMPKSQSPGFDPSIVRHSGILWAANEAMLNKVLKNPGQKLAVNQKKFPDELHLYVLGKEFATGDEREIESQK